jgi:maltooligosyltrehalose trehalohydrolase
MADKTISTTRFGPLLTDRGVTFRLWAPAARQVDLILDRRIPMRQDGEWFVLEVPQAGAGTRYRFRIDDNIEIPDPASQFQPEDVHGPSEVIDHTYHWECGDWKGRPWSDAVFLEAHVGTFTPEGTFRAMIERLDHLAATGITALELMPVSDFPGRWNWGYDGALLFAPDSGYGRPQDLKALIDAAHARRLMVFLDAVYNHFGPGASRRNFSAMHRRLGAGPLTIACRRCAALRSRTRCIGCVRIVSTGCVSMPCTQSPLAANPISSSS